MQIFYGPSLPVDLIYLLNLVEFIQAIRWYAYDIFLRQGVLFSPNEKLSWSNGRKVVRIIG